MATLCTGGGLFEVGAMMARFRPIWGVEFDPDNPEVSSQIADCYERNLGGNLIRQTVQDVAAEGFDKLERPTALHVSPPCKSFSQANQGVRETELDLQMAIAVSQAIRELMPPLFSLENVIGYRDSQSWGTIGQTLDHLGYGIRAEVVNAAAAWRSPDSQTIPGLGLIARNAISAATQSR